MNTVRKNMLGKFEMLIEKEQKKKKSKYNRMNQYIKASQPSSTKV